MRAITLHLPATGFGSLNVTLEHPLQSLCLTLDRRVAIDWRLLRARRVTPSAPQGRDLLAWMMIRREHTVIAREIHPWVRHQRRAIQ